MDLIFQPAVDRFFEEYLGGPVTAEKTTIVPSVRRYGAEISYGYVFVVWKLLSCHGLTISLRPRVQLSPPTGSRPTRRAMVTRARIVAPFLLSRLLVPSRQNVSDIHGLLAAPLGNIP